jgi:putative Mg2+ transporter-C (MgtC) family protein
LPDDVALQLDLALRLLVASILGAAIGLEREIHEHPAGMRTHLLVCLGSAVFTEMSASGFGALVETGQATNVDPTRIAAQIVSGIGFLGAGAILKYGTSVRGLTTAASLWVTAAVGLAVGGGDYIIGLVGTAIAIFSLWPLNVVVERLRLGQGGSKRLRVIVDDLQALSEISGHLSANKVEISGIQTQKLGKRRFEIDLDLRVPSGAAIQKVYAAIAGMAGVEVLDASDADE